MYVRVKNIRVPRLSTFGFGDESACVEKWEESDWFITFECQLSPDFLALSRPNILQVSLVHLKLEHGFFGVVLTELTSSLEGADKGLHYVFGHVLGVAANVNVSSFINQLDQGRLLTSDPVLCTPKNT